MTRRRGYLLLTAVLIAALLIVVYRGVSHGWIADEAIAPLSDEAMSQLDGSREGNAEGWKADGGRADLRRASSRRFGHTSSSNSHTSKVVASVMEPESPPAQVHHKTTFLIFDLNTADSLDLVQLYNIGPAFARRIIKYRSMLGGFVDKSQLWEVYGMDSVRYNDIAPHLTVDAAAVEKMDLNTASVDQLKRHPYLDYYQAKAIVRMREQAGAYHSVRDIMKIPLIDKETFNLIAPYLTCSLQPMK